MDELLKRHIQETDRNFENIHEELLSLSKQIEDLKDFKMRLLISSRFFSFLVSAICGAVTLIASSFVTYLINVKLNKG